MNISISHLFVLFYFVLLCLFKMRKGEKELPSVAGHLPGCRAQLHFLASWKLPVATGLWSVKGGHRFWDRPLSIALAICPVSFPTGRLAAVSCEAAEGPGMDQHKIERPQVSDTLRGSPLLQPHLPWGCSRTPPSPLTQGQFGWGSASFAGEGTGAGCPQWGCQLTTMQNAQGAPWIGSSWQKQQSLLVATLPCSPPSLVSKPNGWCLTVQLPAQLFLMWTVSYHPLSFLLIHMTASPCPAHLVVSHFPSLKAKLEEKGNKPKHTRMLPVSLWATTGMLYNPNFSQAWQGSVSTKKQWGFPVKWELEPGLFSVKTPLTL